MWIRVRAFVFRVLVHQVIVFVVCPEKFGTMTQHSLLLLQPCLAPRTLASHTIVAGVYGFESKDPAYGIQNIRTNLVFGPPDNSLGLELTEFAHSDNTGDHRGLVLVTKVTDDALTKGLPPIHVGDTIIGVFSGTDFKESTTALDYDETVDVIHRAKEHALAQGRNNIELELNRIVKRAHVTVEIEDENGKVQRLEDALAGDNLRLLLLHHQAKLYDESFHRIDQPHLTGDCGGEGICGTCMVQILQGMEHLNQPVGPQESSVLQGRPSTWRAACQTVVGADNVPGTVLRVRLHPHQYADVPLEDEKLRP